MKINSNITKNFKSLINIVEKLRGTNGCDWDKVQTNESLVPYFIEEVYEMIDSIDNKDINNTKEELGDILLHIVLQSQIFKEDKNFNLNDVIINISDKLINRHPNVFNKLNNENNLSDKKKLGITKI